MNEFAHRGADDDHRGFARGCEPEPHGADRGVPAQGGHGGKVKRLAEAPGPDLREATAAAQGARLDEARHEPRKGGGLPRTGVGLVKQLRDEDGRLTYVGGNDRLELIRGLPVHNTGTGAMESL